MNKAVVALSFLLFAPLFISAEEELTQEMILKRIFDKAEHSEKGIDQFGFFQENIRRELEEDGTITEEEKRVYRTTWIGDQRYAELIEVNGRGLTEKEKKEERKRKQKFLNEVKDKRKELRKEVAIAWKEVYDRYDFERLPAEPGAFYVYSFLPKNKTLPERNRTEKVLNHVDGKLWSDENFNLLRVRATLRESVRFGLGVLAKLDKLVLDYELQEHENVWLPASIYLKFDARVALVHRERQETLNRFYDIFPRPDSAGTPAPTSPTQP